MSAEGEREVEAEVVDVFSNVKRAASIVGDLRSSLRSEGFTREETFELVQMYWASELGAFD
ncbi:hypothetical protein SEA_DAUDAU_42 [Streptomyces phage Daudau]|uniref:Uncharacterized protein n=1 Tax=Streptomyces phage Daudau TaxID=2041206 RepID=A0A291LI50_9CAUD|nr:hypothetical protein KGG88_gp42 [Streptomyces phage Daudau]ATI18743.1 hypothetical protein SEA_DAUDAU_42 [Streptomyces phage Daudau]